VQQEHNVWQEYDAAAEWCARRGIAGKPGDRLPELLSVAALREINADPDAFQQRVRDSAYALAMAALEDLVEWQDPDTQNDMKTDHHLRVEYQRATEAARAAIDKAKAND